MKCLSPKNNFNNKNLAYNYFDYENNYKIKKSNEIHNFFGIKLNENKLDLLLKTIPRHKKENIVRNYNNSHSLEYKNQKNDFQKNYIFPLKNIKNYNEKEINKVMPPNKIINYN